MYSEKKLLYKIHGDVMNLDFLKKCRNSWVKLIIFFVQNVNIKKYQEISGSKVITIDLFI